MSVKQMSKTQVNRFARICEEQGIGVTRTKKGLFLRFPDGTSTVQHFTNSDTRAVQNQIARFRRAGMIHPDDTRITDELPSYIKVGRDVEPSTRKRIIEAVISLEFPEFVYSGKIVKATHLDAATVNRALYKMGFRPGIAKSARPGRPWYVPDDILALRENVKRDTVEAPMPTPLDLLRRAQKAQQAINDLGAGKPTLTDVVTADDEARDEDLHSEPVEDTRPVITIDPDVDIRDTMRDPIEPEIPETIEVPQKMADKIDFIDDRDSWTVELKELLGGSWYILEDKLKMIGVLGMEYEFRVWRTK